MSAMVGIVAITSEAAGAAGTTESVSSAGRLHLEPINHEGPGNAVRIHDRAGAAFLRASKDVGVAIDSALIPSRYVNAAVRALPDAWTTRSPQSAEFDVPDVGRLRVHFEWRRQARKGFVPIWMMVRAERVEGDS